MKKILAKNVLYVIYDPQGLSGPRWQQLASRQFSMSAGLCGPDAPPTRADATFKVTMVPGDGVGPELMTAVKEVFKVYNMACCHHECMTKRCPGRCRFVKDGRFLKFCWCNLCCWLLVLNLGRRCPSGIWGVSSERGPEHGQWGKAGASVSLNEEQ